MAFEALVAFIFICIGVYLVYYIEVIRPKRLQLKKETDRSDCEQHIYLNLDGHHTV